MSAEKVNHKCQSFAYSGENKLVSDNFGVSVAHQLVPFLDDKAVNKGALEQNFAYKVNSIHWC